MQLITEAVVYQLKHDTQGRITAANYYDWNKISHRVTAENFVLAANRHRNVEAAADVQQ